VIKVLLAHKGPEGKQVIKGNRGQKGMNIVSWQVIPADYAIIGVFGDDTTTPPLSLLGLFQKFNHDTEGDEIEAAVEQMALSRAELELRVERVRHGLPER
jgi:hypothetical protein